MHLAVNHLLEQFEVYERTVETAYHIVADRRGVLGIEREVYRRMLRHRQFAVHLGQRTDRGVKNGTLAYTIHATQDIYIGTQFPNNMLESPHRIDFDLLNIFSLYLLHCTLI